MILFDEVAFGMRLQSYALPSLLCHPRASPIYWFGLNLNGPYDGQHTQLSQQATFQLKQLPAGHFLAFYNNLCAAITASKFSYDILPAPVDLDYDADLRNTPVDGDTMFRDRITFGPKYTMMATTLYFQHEHNRLSNLLCAIFNNGLLPLSTSKRVRDIVNKNAPDGDGMGVLQDLLLLFHPGMKDNTALTFVEHKLAAPKFNLEPPEDMLAALPRYHTEYTHWLDLLHLYPEHAVFWDVDIPLQFIHGLGVHTQHLLTMELSYLSVFKTHDKRQFHHQGQNLPIPLSLQVEALSEKLKHLLKNLPLMRPTCLSHCLPTLSTSRPLDYFKPS